MLNGEHKRFEKSTILFVYTIKTNCYNWALLSASSVAIKIIFLETTTSTQDVAAQLISSGNSNDTFAVIAKTQSQGRGRVGKAWNSDAPGNLYLSVATRITDLRQITLVPILTATSVATSLGMDSIDGFCYKWPNDIMIGRKKLCGILIEKINNCYIIGIGINLVLAPILPDRETTCLLDENHLHKIGFDQFGKIEVELQKVAEKITLNLAQDLLDFQEKKNCRFLENFNRSLWRQQGDRVTIVTKGKEVSGTLHGINPDGSISIKVRTGEEERMETFFYGDVS